MFVGNTLMMFQHLFTGPVIGTIPIKKLLRLKGIILYLSQPPIKSMSDWAYTNCSGPTQSHRQAWASLNGRTRDWAARPTGNQPGALRPWYRFTSLGPWPLPYRGSSQLPTDYVLNHPKKMSQPCHSHLTKLSRFVSSVPFEHLPCQASSR